jgi:hypothetical protein
VGPEGYWRTDLGAGSGAGAGAVAVDGEAVDGEVDGVADVAPGDAEAAAAAAGREHPFVELMDTDKRLGTARVNKI